MAVQNEVVSEKISKAKPVEAAPPNEALSRELTAMTAFFASVASVHVHHKM
jgi:hypothetical protein